MEFFIWNSQELGKQNLAPWESTKNKKIFGKPRHIALNFFYTSLPPSSYSSSSLPFLSFLLSKKKSKNFVKMFVFVKSSGNKNILRWSDRNQKEFYQKYIFLENLVQCSAVQCRNFKIFVFRENITSFSWKPSMQLFYIHIELLN